MASSRITAQDLVYEIRLLSTHPLLERNLIKFQRSEAWLCIGGSTLPPPDTIQTHFQHHNSSSVPVSEYPLLHPQWYTNDDPHRPYTPDALDVVVQPFYLPRPSWIWHQYSVQNAARFMIGDRVDPALEAIIHDDFDLLIELHNKLQHSSSHSVIRFDYYPYNFTLITGKPSCSQALEKSQAYAIELISAITYNLAHAHPSHAALISSQYSSQLQEWLASMPRLGTLLDPSHPRFHTFPLLTLANNHCPFYLPWDDKYRHHTNPQTKHRLNNLSPDEYSAILDDIFPIQDPPSYELPFPLSRDDFLLNIAVTCRATFPHSFHTSSIPIYQRAHSFSTYIVDLGYLIVSPHAEVLLRYYALTTTKSTNMSIASNILTFALSHGIPFTLAYPHTAQQTFHPWLSSWNRTSPLSSPYPLIPSSASLDSSRSQYLKFLDTFFKIPAAAVVLTQGGLLARIAIEFGDHQLLTRLLRTPSEDVQPNPDFPHLFSDIFPQTLVPNIIGESVGTPPSASESWFPPLDIFNRYLGNTFDWSQACEDWFQKRITVIYRNNSIDARPFRKSEWATSLKRYVSSRIAAVPYTPPHSDTLDSLRTQFHACTGVQWTPQKLSTISITHKRIRYLTLNTSP